MSLQSRLIDQTSSKLPVTDDYPVDAGRLLQVQYPALNIFLGKQYSAVVDIGCGEGYYAIGCAIRLPQAEIYGFDTEPRVRQLCSAMAEVNNVSARVHIGDFCDRETLRTIPLGNKALIISDCEGYEVSLFDHRMAEFLAPHDLIIETHDFIDIEISDKIRNAFADTHRIQSIKSTDDIERVHTCNYVELTHYTLRDKYLILSEFRPSIMEWLVMTSRQDALR